MEQGSYSLSKLSQEDMIDACDEAEEAVSLVQSSAMATVGTIGIENNLLINVVKSGNESPGGSVDTNPSERSASSHGVVTSADNNNRNRKQDKIITLINKNAISDHGVANYESGQKNKEEDETRIESLIVLESISQGGGLIEQFVDANDSLISQEGMNTITASSVYPSVSYAELVKEDLSTLDEVTLESSTGASSNSDLSNDLINDCVTVHGQSLNQSGHTESLDRCPVAEKPPGSKQIEARDTSPESDPLLEPETLPSDTDTNLSTDWTRTYSSLLSSKLVWVIVVIIGIVSTSSSSAILQIVSFTLGILFCIFCIIPSTLYFVYKYFIVWQEDELDMGIGALHMDGHEAEVKMSHSPSLLLSGHTQRNQFKTYSGWVLLRASDADSLLGSKDTKNNSGHKQSVGSGQPQPGASQKRDNSNSRATTNILSVKKKVVHLRIDPPSFIRLAFHKKCPSIKDDPKKVLLMSTSKPESVKIIDLNKYPDRTLRIFKRGPKDVHPGDADIFPQPQIGPPKLKHVWSRRVPIVITLKVPPTTSTVNSPPDQVITLVIWTRDCKDKEVLFWTLFPLFPIGLAHKERILSQQNYLKSKETKSMSKSVSRPTDLSNIAFHRVDAGHSSENNNRRSMQDNWTHVDIDWPLNSSSSIGPVGNVSQEWLNVFLNHCMRDFVSHIKWRKWLHRKMERKLQRIKLPNFMDPLKVRGVIVGSVPKLSDGKFISRDADGQVFLSFILEAGSDSVYEIIDHGDDGKSGLDSENSDIKKKAVFEMSLETKLNPKYFTQHQMLQVSSPNKEAKNIPGHIPEDNESVNDSSESDTEDEDDEPTFESISSNEECESDDDLLDKSDLDDWKLDTTVETASTASGGSGSNENGLELSSMASPSSSPSQSHPLTSWSRLTNQSPAKSLVDRWTDKIKIKSRQILANNPTVRKYFDTFTSSKVGVTVRVNGLKGRLIVCLAAPPSDRVWIKLDDTQRTPSNTSVINSPSDGNRRSTFGSSGTPESRKNSNQSTRPNVTNENGIKLDLEVVVEMNRKALLIKSNFIRNLLEGRLRKQLIEILTTYDDLSLYPLLVLPSCFYTHAQSGGDKSIFCDTF